MGIRNLDFVKALVTAFNVNNYGSKTNTNFVVEGNNIVVKFDCDQRSAEECLSQMARDLVREYFLNEDVARHVFNLTSFPFNFNKGRWALGKTGAELAVPIDSGVIFNLKVHFAEEFKNDVRRQMIREIDKELCLGKKRIEELLIKNIQQLAMGASSHYIKCLLFHNPGIQEHFERVLQAQMKKHGYNYLDFCDIDYENKRIYFKDVEDIDFVKDVTELSKKKAGYDLRFPSSNDLKVRKYKDAIGGLIFSLTGIKICGYYRDSFIDGDRASNEERYAFVPMIKDGRDLRHLDYVEANKINAKFSYDLLTNVRGQTEGAKSGAFGDIYAFSDKQIALLIPLIIENSVINKDGQIEINPELFVQSLSRSPSTDMSDTQWESPKRNQGKQTKEPPRQASEEGKGRETGALQCTIL